MNTLTTKMTLESCLQLRVTDYSSHLLYWKSKHGILRKFHT